MGVRLIGVALAPGSEPLADPRGRAGPIAIMFGGDLSRWIWIAVGWQVPAGATPVTATSDRLGGLIHEYHRAAS
jgi:hypothetical protein